MGTGVIAKSVVLAGLLIAAGALLGIVCERVYRQYVAFLSPGPELVYPLIWVFGAIGLIAVTAGLVVALVRPFGVIVITVVLSALAMVLAWRLTLATALSGLLFVVFATIYARSVIDALSERIRFSVQPIGQSQGLLLFAPVLLVSVSVAAGYAEDASRREALLPLEYKQAAVGTIADYLRSQIQEQRDLPAQLKATALEQARANAERSWTSLEAAIKPFARFLPYVFALTVLLTLQLLVTAVSLLSWLVLSAIFLILRRTGATRTVTTMKETSYLVLG